MVSPPAEPVEGTPSWAGWARAEAAVAGVDGRATRPDRKAAARAEVTAVVRRALGRRTDMGHPREERSHAVV